MAKAANCTVQDEINEELGYCLKLLKDYESSSVHF